MEVKNCETSLVFDVSSTIFSIRDKLPTQQVGGSMSGIGKNHNQLK